MMWSATSPAVQRSPCETAPQTRLASAASIARVSPAAAVCNRSRRSAIDILRDERQLVPEPLDERAVVHGHVPLTEAAQEERIGRGGDPGPAVDDCSLGRQGGLEPPPELVLGEIGGRLGIDQL